ncbi:MAG: hypothetical protein U1F77_08360 [Kiritimatiellia bacterium]
MRTLLPVLPLLALLAGSCGQPSAVKIGFLVKQPEEPWFQTEWRLPTRPAGSWDSRSSSWASPTRRRR